MNKKWTIAPGEKHQKVHISKGIAELEELIEKMTTEYVRDKQDKKVLVMAEDERTLYFLVFSDEGQEEMEYADVFLVNPTTEEFEKMPRGIAKPISDAYLKHITALAGAYTYMRNNDQESN